ncbi:MULTISPECIES: CvfD/Ygs/GSP13 family RNA-binding post-transcriptional regulator [Ligilactobacillus]|jgi:general stress protein 13|uniref:CvfD/Ygs/GSP13 family RNA-binding post-transcriptional regulator n=1 Tax=Ligilactobacillus TaxID=2767887 RepID=UPI002598B0C9|nr:MULTISPECIES: CvfD/Ygs/GSP13 family RNA-binding post-transcriptional regulator [Ligilactobacillus]WOY89856.1 CvfD/Ygs/GSP13 family RNA-binding post-transcriptional regulator [Ligilactobacillus murinus]
MEIAYRIGMVLEGYVTGIQPYGAFVALDEETQGLIHISECHHGFVDDIQNYLKVGQRVRVMIIDIDEYTQKISLSVRCLEKTFDFNQPRHTRYQHKKYWTNRHVYEGFTPIAKRLDHWVDEALADIAAGK